jgi:hypothetical protein
VWIALGAFDDLDLLFFTAIPEFDLSFLDVEPRTSHKFKSDSTSQ